MVTRVPKETVQKIQANVNIIDIVSQYVTLQSRGKNYVGLCPFHSERTPSFTVAEDKQVFHCFSCGRGGSVFSFIKEVEHIDYTDAVIKVAQMIDFPLDLGEQGQEGKADPLQGFYKAHQAAQDFYSHILLHTRGGEKGLDYLAARGLKPDTIEKFGFGFALADRTKLVQVLKGQDLGLDQLEETGLILQQEAGGQIDRFGNRLMIPLRDSQGRVIAFSGRILPGQEDDLGGDTKAKYLNSPETPLFSKGKFLFNLDLAKSAIRKEQEIVLFEGYMDVISAWQAGVLNGIASMGTSLTDEQIHQMRRLSKRIVIAYDGDRAGQEATNRAIEKLTQVGGFEIKILPMDQGLDPDEWIQKRGAQSFLDHLKHDLESVFDFRKRYLLGDYHLEVPSQRVEYLQKVIESFVYIENPLEEDMVISQLSQEFSIDRQVLLGQVRQLGLSKKQRSTQNQPKLDQPRTSLSLAELNKSERGQVQLLFHLLKDPAAWTYLANVKEDFSFLRSDLEQVYLLLKDFRDQLGPDFEVRDFLDFLDQEDSQNRQLVMSIDLLDLPPQASQEEVEDLVGLLHNRNPLKDRYQALQVELKQAQLANDLEKQKSLLVTLIEIQKQLKN